MLSPGSILVTGGGGRLGTALARLGTLSMPREALDITNFTQVTKCLEMAKPNLVINAAAYTDVDKAEDEQLRAAEINATGAGNVAAACARLDIPLIQISTDCVFGDGDPAHPMTETGRPNPLSVYGQTKLAGELAVQESGARAMIVRVSWLHDDGADTFIGKMLTLGARFGEMNIVDDAFGRPTHVKDLAEYLLRVSGRWANAGCNSCIYHFGSPGPVNRFEWAKIIFEESKRHGAPAPVIFPCGSDVFPEKARRPRGLFLDVTAAEVEFGPMPHWQEATCVSVRAFLQDEMRRTHE